MRRGETTWPQVLRDQLGYQVLDLSQAGATVASAMTQGARVPAGPSVVLIEIGGNDLLGNTSSGEFESGLRKLLDRVHGAGRQVLMFELPLLPLRNEYGRIQRRLAEEYGAVLIPKRVLAGAIGLRGGTLDGLHLSDEGHQSIARSVSSILGT
jgi:acyl-CoA thioesterase-1